MPRIVLCSTMMRGSKDGDVLSLYRTFSNPLPRTSLTSYTNTGGKFSFRCFWMKMSGLMQLKGLLKSRERASTPRQFLLSSDVATWIAKLTSASEVLTPGVYAYWSFIGGKVVFH